MNSSPEWDTYAELQLSLHPHIDVIPQVFRGARWHLLKNNVTGNFTRLNGLAFRFISRLNAQTTLHSQFCRFNQAAPEDQRLDTSETIALIRSLVASDFLKIEQATDAVQQAELTNTRNNKKLMAWVSNPLSIKIPLVDPDKALDRLSVPMRVVFTRTSLALWLLALLFALYVTANNHHAISNALSTDFFRPENLILMTIAFIVIKLLHELAHAIAVKHWAGSVNEMGITFLVFSPIPYVDASSAWAFQDKYKRVVVCAMGIIAELLIASCAIILWSVCEPGLLKTLALNSAVIASVSTLAFNANPLLKFDGYYILQDLIEIPNLYQRSKKYLTYLLAKHIAGVKNNDSPVYAEGEETYLFCFGVLSLIYRVFLLAIISLFLINELFIVGVVLSLWAVLNQFIKPATKAISFLLNSQDIDAHRTQSIVKSGAFAIALIACTCVFPFPDTTFAKGVVWVDRQAEIFSSQEAFISEVLITSGTQVEAGTELLKLSSPTLDTQIKKLEARKRELQISSRTEYVKSGGKSAIDHELLQSLNFELEQLYDNKAALLIKAQVAGRFFSPDIIMRTGTHLKRGEFIGYVFSPEKLIVQAVFPQSDIGYIRESVENVEVRFAEDTNKRLAATVQRETPSSSPELPNKALGATGGGDIIVKNQESAKPIAQDEHFQIDFSLQSAHNMLRIGGVVFIRIEHAAAPLVKQISHALQQLLMAKINN